MYFVQWHAQIWKKKQLPKMYPTNRQIVNVAPILILTSWCLSVRVSDFFVWSRARVFASSAERPHSIAPSWAAAAGRVHVCRSSGFASTCIGCVSMPMPRMLLSDRICCRVQLLTIARTGVVLCNRIYLRSSIFIASRQLIVIDERIMLMNLVFNVFSTQQIPFFWLLDLILKCE